MPKTLENSEKPRRRPGRPSRDDEVRRALGEIGCDPASINPLRILASIAVDLEAPASARVAACKVLIGAPDRDDGDEIDEAARLNARAAVIMLRRAN